MERNYFCIFRFEENVRCELANNIKKLVQRELTMRLQEGFDDAVYIFFHFFFIIYLFYTSKSTKSMHLLMYHKKILTDLIFLLFFILGLN